MNVTIRVVASLIATTVLACESTASFAQNSAPWAGVAPVTGVEFGTKDEAGNCQVLRNGQTSCRYYMTAKTSEITALDGFATRPGLQFKRTGETIQGFPPGTPGTVTMRKLMFCLGGTINASAQNVPEQSGAVRCNTANTVYSHVITPEKARSTGVSDVLVDNATLNYFLAPQWAGYVEDQGDVGLAFVLPYKQMIAGREYAFCPTGTRDVRKWYNNAFARASASTAVINDGNWRFSNHFAWRDSNLPKGYETSYDDEMFCGPAQVEKLWVVNERPEGVASGTGKFLSVFTLDPINWAQSARTDIVVADKSRSVTFDNSRNVAYMPERSHSTSQVKSLGPTVSNVAMIPDDRLTALVYEPTGEVFHLTSSVYGRRVFVYNPKTNQIWDFIPATGVVPNVDLTGDQVIQGAIFGDMFVRVIGVTENGVVNALTTTKVEVYDIPSRTQRAVYTINKQLANSGQIFGLRPEVSLDPRTNTLWIASPYEGTLGSLNLTTSIYTEIPIPQESGITAGATDVEVDTTRNKLYVSIAKFRPTWFGASTPFVDGSLYEIDLATKQIARQTNLQVYPWSVSVLSTATGTFVAVTNNATVSGNNLTVPSTVSVVDVATFAEVARMQTQNQPTATAVDFKD